jgi:1-acyl-sn-glycerol-3-phosphate acyltransferase
MRSLPETPLASEATTLAPPWRWRAVALATLRAFAFLAVTLCLLPLFVAAGAVASGPRNAIGRLWCRCCLRLFGLEVRCRGEPVAVCATLFLANHVSYLDIVLLGARVEATFVAKAEVRGWPLFGAIGRAAGTFFIRRRWRDALVQRNTLAARLRAGESFILFAEGTSTDGLDVLPLKTSLLSVAEPWVLDRPIAVQPVTLAYRRLKDGTPIHAGNCHRYAWFGDMALVPHLWAMLKDEGCVVEIVFGEPILSWAVTSRKVLGREMRRALLAPLRGAAPAVQPERQATIGLAA